jgi:hypothetical protein
VTNALRRRLNSLRQLAEHAATPPDEAAAAELAIGRVLLRLGEPVATEPARHNRSRRPSARPHEEPLAVGQVIDCHVSEGTFRRCRCGSSTFAVEEGGSSA